MDVFKRVPLAPKELRKGKKDVVQLNESLWGDAFSAADELSDADTRWVSQTREIYRAQFFRFLVPIIIKKK